jgi:hypothetical protein
MSDLTALAEAKFGKQTLSDAEKLLLEKAAVGEPAICANDKNNNLEDAGNWGPERQIRAALVVWLCTDREAREQVHGRGIQVLGADVTGPLGLALVSIPFQLAFRHCRLKEILLNQADVAQLDLQGSLVDGIKGDRVNVKNYVLLREGFKATGNVWLLGARIGADLDCSNGIFTNPAQGGPAAGTVLYADAIDVKGSVLLRGMNASGGVRIRGAQISGELDCTGGVFTTSPGLTALDAIKMNVKGGVVLSRAFSATGEVALGGAQIDGDLACVGGVFSNPPRKGVKGSGCALSADGINVKGAALLRECVAGGEVRLPGAQIGDSLDFDNVNFTNPPLKDVAGSGDALTADGINVKGSIFVRGSTVTGKVRLPGAQVGIRLDCSGGSFRNPPLEGVDGSGEAISAEGIVVKSEFILRNCTAAGKLDFEGAEIGGAFKCERANLQAATLDLRDAAAGSLYDSGLDDATSAAVQQTKWPQPGHLHLDGFVYGRISSEGRINVSKRLAWLGLQPSPPFRQQPYLHLAKILADSGDSDGGLRVLEKKEALLRSSDAPGWVARFWNWFLRVSIGYGYYPGRAIWLIIILSLLGWIVYGASYRAGTMIPTDKDAFNAFNNKDPLPAYYPAFSPLVYSVENSLPLVKLGQGDKWQPLGGFVLCFYRMQILFGWLLGTLFVAGVSGIVHKE